MTARFAPADIGADLSALPAGEREALAQAGRGGAASWTRLFLRQVWAGNDAMLQELAHAGRASPVGPRASRTAAARLHYFLINKGPWDRARSQQAVRARRAGEAGGGQLLPGRRDQGRGRDSGSTGCRATAKAAATGFFTTIRRGADRASPRCPTASNTRASSRAPPTCCAKRRR